MKISREHTTFQVTSEAYEVLHLYMHDQFCDLHLLAHDKDKSEQLLIPVHKKILVEHLEYFANMFKDTSNFIENNSEEMNTLVPIVNIEVDNPRVFGKYLSVFYGQEFNLTGANFLEFYKMADFFTDNKMIDEISDFINSLEVNDKLTNNNIVELSRYTENFDETIRHYINNFLDVKQAYKLSQISNRFKIALNIYFEKPIFDGFGQQGAE